MLVDSVLWPPTCTARASCATATRYVAEMARVAEALGLDEPPCDAAAVPDASITDTNAKGETRAVATSPGCSRDRPARLDATAYGVLFASRLTSAV